MEEPVFFRSAMVVAVAHQRALQGTSHALEKTNLIHKIAIINTVKEQLKRFSTDISDYFVPIMSVLFMTEVRLQLFVTFYADQWSC